MAITACSAWDLSPVGREDKGMLSNFFMQGPYHVARGRLSCFASKFFWTVYQENVDEFESLLYNGYMKITMH